MPIEAILRVPHPDAGPARRRVRAATPKRAHVSISAALERAHVAVHVAPVGAQADDRVGDELARAVVGRAAAAADAKHRHAEALRRAAQIGGVGAAAERVDGRGARAAGAVRPAPASFSATSAASCRRERRRVRHRARAAVRERASAEVATPPATGAAGDRRGARAHPSSSVTGFSRMSLQSLEKAAALDAVEHAVVARQRQRAWSCATASCPSRTTGRSLTAPTARIAACGGLITAASSSTSSMPTLDS